jgi:acetyl-CoA acetyltransferase
MLYTDPTPADVKADFPAFADVDDFAVQRRIDRTASWIDDSWLVSDYNYAKSLLTAHYLTVDGFGSTSDAEIAAYRSAGVARLKSGTLDVSFTTDEYRGVSASEFDASVYGQRFAALLRKNKSGVLTTGGSVGCVGAASTDVPFAYAFGGIGL